MLTRTIALAALAGSLLAVGTGMVSLPVWAAPAPSLGLANAAGSGDAVIKVGHDRRDRRHHYSHRGDRHFGHHGYRRHHGYRGWSGYRHWDHRRGHRHYPRGCRVGPQGVGCRF